jgi:hypothetical protein
MTAHRPLLSATLCFVMVLVAPRDTSIWVLLLGALLIGACVAAWPKVQS